jgi:hypothetical protein
LWCCSKASVHFFRAAAKHASRRLSGPPFHSGWNPPGGEGGGVVRERPEPGRSVDTDSYQRRAFRSALKSRNAAASRLSAASLKIARAGAGLVASENSVHLTRSQQRIKTCGRASLDHLAPWFGKNFIQ